MSGQAPRAVEIPPCGCGSPDGESSETCYCSVDDLLRVIRRRYSLALMNAIRLHRGARFRDLALLLPQASTSTLAETLGALQAAHLVVHHTAEAMPTSYYSLTTAGETLLSRLRRLLDEVGQ